MVVLMADLPKAKRRKPLSREARQAAAKYRELKRPGIGNGVTLQKIAEQFGVTYNDILRAMNYRQREYDEEGESPT